MGPLSTLPTERRREIASKGGKAAQASSKVHRWTREEARTAGMIGGRAHSPEHMAKLGSIGGAAKKRKRHRIKCTVCERPYMAIQARQKYCCDACAKYARQKRES